MSPEHDPIEDQEPARCGEPQVWDVACAAVAQWLRPRVRLGVAKGLFEVPDDVPLPPEVQAGFEEPAFLGEDYVCTELPTRICVARQGPKEEGASATSDSSTG